MPLFEPAYIAISFLHQIWPWKEEKRRKRRGMKIGILHRGSRGKGGLELPRSLILCRGVE
ncbi:hypothetical protein Pyn_23775 [Prunus yedoensis var. nudiflora]|uniref:Uncharacterized protein n=1 Tax=Prunus yedoensis var. nudiflora TaxID=2094558 RepID=A0A314ZLN7_PRUYE|nr:hypothetical protein Pyn_23775 [Prunus yedoensis var. nudiflora]